jgi:hypothetical protein
VRGCFTRSCRIDSAPSSGPDGRSAGLQACLNLIIEVTGEARKDKAAKVTTARTLWVPAVNNHGGFGRWAFVEVTDPWDAQRTIRASVNAVGAGAF